MRFSTVVAATAAALAVDASPAPVMRIAADSINWNWTVTNWEAGCSRSGCYYNFNVSAPAFTGSPQAPAFAARCFGENEGAPYTACTMLGEPEGSGKAVAARLLEATRVPGENTIPHFAVSYQYADLEHPGTVYNWTAFGSARYNQFVLPEMTFNITPSEVFGIA